MCAYENLVYDFYLVVNLPGDLHNVRCTDDSSAKRME